MASRPSTASTPAIPLGVGARPIFVTGGSGRLASLIADWFNRVGEDRVTLFSRSAGAGREAMDLLFDPSIMAGADMVLHLAWSSLPATSEQQPDLGERQDLPLLRRLLASVEAVPANRRPHFVFFSTGGAVYGNAPGRPNREDDACQPIGQYGRVKRRAEQLVEEWSAQTGSAATILRISNPYGYAVPQERPQGIIPHAIRSALAGTPLTLWGDGTARKDFIHRRDFLEALARVIEHRPKGTFNLSAGESHTLLEVIGEVERQTGRKIARTHVPAVPWDVHDSRLDNAKLCGAVGWKPSVSLAEGIRRSLVAEKPET